MEGANIMKINWFSNSPWAATGYGNQTKLFYNRIRALGHELSVTAFYGLQGGVIDMGGVTVFPVVKHPYGQDVIGSHAAVWGADIIITLMDIWAVQPENIPERIGWYPWFPIDTEPVHEMIVANVRKARKGITMSKFGQREMSKIGIDTYYVPHGVETNVFKPLPDKRAAREVARLPQDRYIVGMVAANHGLQPIRKAFVEQVEAFARFKQTHPDALMYIHTNDGVNSNERLNLPRLFTKMGLKACYLNPSGVPAEADICLPDQYQYALSYPDYVLNAMYNSFDVMTLVSMGEGFGIPLIEAQAAGCPVITGEWSSMGELCFGGWKVKREEARRTWIEGFSSYMYAPSPDAILDRMTQAYEMRNNRDYNERARQGAQMYDADRALEKYWKPVLEDIAKRTKGEETELELVRF